MARRTNLNLQEEFQKEFLNKSYRYGVMPDNRTIVLMESAYIAGAKAMMRDTLDTLGDYACACAGLEPRLIKPETVYDNAEADLRIYYDKILDKIDKIDDKITDVPTAVEYFNRNS